MCEFSTHQATVCDTSWVSCTLLQFWHNLSGVSTRSQKLRVQSHKSIPLQTPITKSQVVAYSSDSSIITWGPQNPFLGLHSICWNGSQNSGKHWCLPVYFKEYNKGYKWTARWRDTRSGMVLSTGAPIPMGLRCSIRLACRCVHQPRSSLNSILLGFFMEAPSRRHDQSLTISSPCPLPRGWEWGGVESSKLLITDWPFWWLALIQEPTKSHLIRTKDTTITEEIPRVLGPLCQEPGAETNIYIFYYFTPWRHFHVILCLS